MHWKTIILTVAATIAAVAFVATQHYPEFSDQARGDIAELISVEADTPAVIITPAYEAALAEVPAFGRPGPGVLEVERVVDLHRDVGVQGGELHWVPSPLGTLTLALFGTGFFSLANRLLKKSSRAVSALNRWIAAHANPFVFKGFL